LRGRLSLTSFDKYEKSCFCFLRYSLSPSTAQSPANHSALNYPCGKWGQTTVLVITRKRGLSPFFPLYENADAGEELLPMPSFVKRQKK
jgi:hypothetical protein